MKKKYNCESYHPLNGTWRGMLKRCENQKHVAYKNYGGRGIKVCERWHSFQNFVDDVGERPVGLTLDRIDNNGNYEPGNVRWATRKQQSENREYGIYFINGQRMTLKQVSLVTGIGTKALIYRMSKYGLTITEAIAYQIKLSVPPPPWRSHRRASKLAKPKRQSHQKYGPRKFININGEVLSILQAAEKFGLKPTTISVRLHRGDSHEEAVRVAVPKRKAA